MGVCRACWKTLIVCRARRSKWSNRSNYYRIKVIKSKYCRINVIKPKYYMIKVINRIKVTGPQDMLVWSDLKHHQKKNIGAVTCTGIQIAAVFIQHPSTGIQITAVFIQHPIVRVQMYHQTLRHDECVVCWSNRVHWYQRCWYYTTKYSHVGNSSRNARS
jgi:hypothetical protein